MAAAAADDSAAGGSASVDDVLSPRCGPFLDAVLAQLCPRDIRNLRATSRWLRDSVDASLQVLTWNLGGAVAAVAAAAAPATLPPRLPFLERAELLQVSHAHPGLTAECLYRIAASPRLSAVSLTFRPLALAAQRKRGNAVNSELVQLATDAAILRCLHVLQQSMAPRLTTLELKGLACVTPDCLGLINGALTRLTSLHIHTLERDLDPEAYAVLGSLPLLSRLHLSDAYLTPSALTALLQRAGPHYSLRCLELPHAPLTRQHFLQLAFAPFGRLQELHLGASVLPSPMQLQLQDSDDGRVRCPVLCRGGYGVRDAADGGGPFSALLKLSIGDVGSLFKDPESLETFMCGATRLRRLDLEIGTVMRRDEPLEFNDDFDLLEAAAGAGNADNGDLEAAAAAADADEGDVLARLASHRRLQWGSKIDAMIKRRFKQLLPQFCWVPRPAAPGHNDVGIIPLKWRHAEEDP